MECLIEAVRADVRSAPEPPAVPCKGKNCGSIDPRLHSADCFEEYERSSGASLPPSAWQPIATAPKYQDVLLWRADAGAMIGQWRGMDGLIDENDEAFDADFEAWFANDTGWMEGAEAPTDWQPLPSGPTKGDNHG